MYVPHFNTMDDPEVHGLVAAVGAAELITVGTDGYPLATLLPVLWEEDRLVLHMARATARRAERAGGGRACTSITRTSERPPRHHLP